jgi:hypothetical protein
MKTTPHSAYKDDHFYPRSPSAAAKMTGDPKKAGRVITSSDRMGQVYEDSQKRMTPVTPKKAVNRSGNRVAAKKKK